MRKGPVACAILCIFALLHGRAGIIDASKISDANASVMPVPLRLPAKSSSNATRAPLAGHAALQSALDSSRRDATRLHFKLRLTLSLPPAR